MLRTASSLKFFDRTYVRKGSLEYNHPYPVYNLPESMTLAQLLNGISFAGLSLPSKHNVRLKSLQGMTLDPTQTLRSLKTSTTVVLRLDLDQMLSCNLMLHETASP